ncbi:MAG: hypothetical protein ACXVLT_07805 [Flavisolibacter sp.]
MSERLPYEEIDRQFNDLPMPDEESSWQKMKERLDKDDDDGAILPPVLLRSCVGWGLVLMIGLTIAWLVIRPERWWTEITQSQNTSNSNSPNKQTRPGNLTKEEQRIQQQPNKQAEANIIPGEKEKTSNTTVQRSVTVAGNITSSLGTGINGRKNQVPKAKVETPRRSVPVALSTKDNNKPNNIHDNEVTRQGEKATKIDTSFAVNKQQQSPATDSIKKEVLFEPTDSAAQKKSVPTRKKLIVAAGLGEQQLIPIAGQTLVPYSYYGRNGSIADYIPSVYFQLHKTGKWFIMGEFRFGAAQSVKEFSYNRKTRYDTSTMNTTVTTMRLKKTYYHQLPVSFNYYLLPNLSFGVGGMYSRFYGAVTEKETDTWNNLTQKYTNVKQIIPMKHFSDSFLYKTQVHVLLQADYQWKRFSFGLRYTRDIQPYIKYTKPDGTVDEKRNESLQLMVRYRLWQSAKL